MTDFQKALAALRAADISFFAPNVLSVSAASPSLPRKRRSIRRVSGQTADIGNSAATIEKPAQNEAADINATQTHSPVSTVQGNTAIKNDVNSNTVDKPPRTRQYVDHEWPPVGTIVSGNYFGTVYRAMVVTANKKLKSGRQLKLLDGPAKGKRCDSFTKALLIATAKQRKETNLGRKQASNGWSFWRPEIPAGTSALGAKAS